MENKIGIGVLTCNRPELFSKCIEGVPDVGCIVVVNDGQAYESRIYPSKVTEVIQHSRNKGVGPSKNDAFSFLMDHGCEHIFLCEDDVAVKNPEIVNKYIRISEISGLKHFNYAYHGPSNKNKQGLPDPVFKVSYGDVIVGLHRHLGGAFSYYQTSILKEIGLIDKRFKNAFDHLDHTYQMIKKDYYSPFWYFADILDSFYDIEDLDQDLSRSVIRRNKISQEFRVRYADLKFTMKNGHRLNRVPKLDKGELLEKLKNIQTKYGNMHYPIKAEF